MESSFADVQVLMVRFASIIVQEGYFGQWSNYFPLSHFTAGKGFWSEMLGVGDFYYELGVQIIEVCLALKHRNGGLITLEELHQQVLKGRGKFAQDVSQDDLLRAIKKLKVLGNGFGIIPVGGTYLIQSVPAELNMDHTVVLQLAEKKGYVTVSEIRSSLKWETERAKQVLVCMKVSCAQWSSVTVQSDCSHSRGFAGDVITVCTGDPMLAGGPKAEYTLCNHTLRRAESQQLQIFLWFH
ncbi:vacuolar-sorting protein SNF8 isoform 1-T1 [Podargus strigoides]